MSTWTHHRARVARLSQSRSADDPDLVDARRDLKAERLADHIRRVVNEAPALTAEQAAQLRALLPVPAEATTVEREAS